MKVCGEPGCPEPTTSTYCAKHTKAKRKQSDKRRPSSKARGYDHRWARTRAKHLKLYPLCTECGAQATDVHHLDGLGPTGPRGHDETNLESRCHSHHSQLTARESPAGWNT